jgi:hypothetical protein
VVTAGVGGTAMPTWGGALTSRQLYGIAYYVRSLALQRGTPAGRSLQDELSRQPPDAGPAAAEAVVTP